MLEMTITAVAQSVKYLLKFATAVLGVFTWQLFSGGYRSTLDIQLISRFRLRLEFMVLFQHGAPGVIVQPSKGFKSGEFGATYSSQ